MKSLIITAFVLFDWAHGASNEGSQCNARIEDWVALVPQFSITQALVNSSCIPQNLNSTLQSMSGEGITVFLPTDAAWNATFDMSNYTGFSNNTCNATMSDGDITNCYEMFTGPLNETSIEDLGSCLSLLPAYHLVRGRHENLLMSTGLGGKNNMTNQTSESSAGNQGNVTVLYTALGSETGFSGNFSQVLIATSMPDGRAQLQGGVQTANITRKLSASDGVIYLIDRVLIPPLPLNNTLLTLGESQLGDQVANLTLPQSGYTAFLPAFGTSNSTSANITNTFNASSFIIPEVIYLNATSGDGSEISGNYTAIDGSPFSLESMNSTLIVNGTYPIIAANIPLSDGVLHLFNYTAVSPSNVTSVVNATVPTTGPGAANSTYLNRNIEHWRRWIYGQGPRQQA